VVIVARDQGNGSVVVAEPFDDGRQDACELGADEQQPFLYRAESRDAACELLFWGRFRRLGGIRRSFRRGRGAGGSGR
jgi:hypothetical protein